jgi:hypothetical protein
MSDMDNELFKPKDFLVFCTNCGTYDVDVFVNTHEEIVFECNNEECDMKEYL